MMGYNEVRARQLGILGYAHTLLVLQLLSITLLAGVLLAILAQGSKDPSSPGMENIYQELSQLKAEVDLLCHRCPWDWSFFQGNCYFFSKIQNDWNNSVLACQEAGARLVAIKSDEEKTFLQVMFKTTKAAWIGLSDLTNEGRWHWLDGSPLSQ
uniref:CD209 antigen-like protein E n=1 Tax=Castor canadensis TaxID=51338 RepID=A0A8B7TSW8_CASCN